MAFSTWLVKEGGGDVTIRIYVSGSPAALVMKGFSDTSLDMINRTPDRDNPILSVAPTGARINDATSVTLNSLGQDGFYDVELRASSYLEDTVSSLALAVLQSGKIVPAIVNNQIGTRRPDGSFKSLQLGKAKHTPSVEEIFAAQFSIDAI